MRNRLIVYLIILVMGLTVGNGYTAGFSRPAGIFTLGQGTIVPSSTIQLSFVDGFVYRAGWNVLETTQGQYNFASIDSAIAVLEPRGKKMTLDIFNLQVPGYILSASGVSTYVAYNPSLGDFTTTVPWDFTAQSRWNIFCQALSNHSVADHSQPGNPLVPLRNHPVLYQVDCPIVGIQAVRDLQNRLVNSPQYNRTSFITATMQSIHSMLDVFPNQYHSLAFFRMSDSISSPMLDVYLLDTVMREFNSSGNPGLGLFVENLACYTPTTSFAFALYQSQSSTYTMMQMLQPWLTPFSNASSTDNCLVTTVPGDRTTATSGPEVGIQYGNSNFGCKYFEVYANDLEHPGFADEFQYWHNVLNTAYLGDDWIQFH